MIISRPRCIGWLVSIACLTATITQGQVPETLDSLKVYFKTHSVRDTNYVTALNNLAWELHLTGNPDYKRADSVLQVSEKLAIKLNYRLGLSKAYNTMGSVYFHSDRPKQALAYFQKALSVAEREHLPIKYTCGVIANVASAYTQLEQYDKVVAVHLRSLRLQEQHNLQPRLANTYNGLGHAYKNLKKPREALLNFQQALAIARSIDNVKGMAIAENNMGRCYDDLEQYEQALRYYRAALKHAEQIQFELLQADILINTGLVLRLLKRPAEGLPYVQRSLAIAKKQQNQGSMATSLFNIGQIYQDIGQFGPAETYLKQAFTLAKENRNQQKIMTYTEGLADLYYDMKVYKLAYEFGVTLAALKDSATTQDAGQRTQELITRYETEKKEAQIKLLGQQAQLREEALEQSRFRTTALLIGGVLLLLLIVAVSAWLLNRARLRRLQEAQQLRKQIAHDLHDEVGSTLSSISLLSGMVNGLIAQNRPESVGRAIEKINTDARQILEAVDEIIWTINPGNDSLQRIALRLQEYARPLMESKSIRFTFATDPELENLPISMEVRRNLYLISKEAINNLVKYSEATQATVRFERRKEQLAVLIEDNGRGFDPTQPSERTGQTSMQQRAKAMGGLLEVRSAPGEGTKLELTTTLAGS